MTCDHHSHHNKYNNNNPPIEMVAPRPRLLYSAAFAWLAITGGRFLAPFLEHEAHYSDALVGTVLAAQSALSSVLGSVGGSWADARERHFANKGRAQVMFTGVVVGSVSFLLHGSSLVFPSVTLFSSTEWHFGLRIIWACSLSLIMPVLDGMTLAYLEKTPGVDPSDYGKERLYGLCFVQACFVNACEVLLFSTLHSLTHSSFQSSK